MKPSLCFKQSQSLGTAHASSGLGAAMVEYCIKRVAYAIRLSFSQHAGGEQLLNAANLFIRRWQSMDANELCVSHLPTH